MLNSWRACLYWKSIFPLKKLFFLWLSKAIGKYCLKGYHICNMYKYGREKNQFNFIFLPPSWITVFFKFEIELNTFNWTTKITKMLRLYSKSYFHCIFTYFHDFSAHFRDYRIFDLWTNKIYTDKKVKWASALYQASKTVLIFRLPKCQDNFKESFILKNKVF